MPSERVQGHRESIHGSLTPLFLFHIRKIPGKSLTRICFAGRIEKHSVRLSATYVYSDCYKLLLDHPTRFPFYRFNEPVYFCANCLTLAMIAIQESESSQNPQIRFYTHIGNPTPGRGPAPADHRSPPCASQCVHTWGSVHARVTRYRTWSPAGSGRTSASSKTGRG